MRVQRLALMMILASQAVTAQIGRDFTDGVDHFKITLVGDWQPVTYIDAVGRRKTEFVYQDRNEGLLRVTVESLRGLPLGDRVRAELNELHLRYSCVDPGTEAFEGGSLTGTKIWLSYVERGRWYAGTFYYLKDTDRVWILKFTGRAGSKAMMPDVTDSVARSFCSVCAVAVYTVQSALPARVNPAAPVRPTR